VRLPAGLDWGEDAVSATMGISGRVLGMGMIVA
jgi:hypothetical protein